LNDARAQFSKVFDDALAGEPQRITRYGKDAVIVVSEAEWNKVRPRYESLGALLVDAAERGVFDGLEFDRSGLGQIRALGSDFVD
jgi:prevent-host-death family protein